IKGEFNSDGIDGFIIIDIDKNDKLKEIAVHTPGPSDDDEYLVYWYDGNKIFLMEYFGGWPEFQGNGMVYLDQWQGFWARRDKYVLDKEKRKMKFIEQFAYYVGAKVTVKNSFTIYKETNLKDEVALLKKGSEVEILICDCIKREYFDYKYLIKSESGLLGWSGIDAILENTEGLIMAD
ncbi:MAG: hypothetical protein JXA68_11295, partial [Ignavibacteriales bacterium]|nr:hypothetical protein [Ignavibacteriales bacterium]